MRGAKERCVICVAAKILHRGRLAGARRRLQAELLAAADLGGLPLAGLEGWYLWGRPSVPGGLEGDLLEEEFEALRGLLRRLCGLYGVGLEAAPPQAGLALLGPEASRAYASAPASAMALERPEEADLEYFLKLLFGKERFRPGQREALSRLLEGKDAFVLLPTGSGKSLVFQLAACLLPGTCLVVEPTLSLIEDQLRRLRGEGFERVRALTSEAEDGRRRAKDLRDFASGRLHFCYVSPERLQTASFRRAFGHLVREGSLALAVVDEAHCVSEWGHDFRVAYLRAASLLRAQRASFPVAALTGTASPSVLAESRRLLGMGPGAALIEGGSQGAGSLRFHLIHCKADRKPHLLERVLDKVRGAGSGIVFCPTVEGERGARSVAQYLRSLGLETGVYHGKAPRGMDERSWRGRKREAAEAFLEGRVPLLAATKAFGLGIDKPDVRFTVHLGLPSSVEAFRPEAGRAGRDGKGADCWLILSVGDARRAERLLDARLPHARALRGLEESARPLDDALSALSLHCAAYPGEEREWEDIRIVLERLGEEGKPGARTLSMPLQHQPLIERALHRLCRLGVAEDYTVRYCEPSFEVSLTGASPGQVRRRLLEECGIEVPEQAAGPGDFARAYLVHLYRTVERERRAALGRMLHCALAQDDAEFSRRLESSLSS